MLDGAVTVGRREVPTLVPRLGVTVAARDGPHQQRRGSFTGCEASTATVALTLLVVRLRVVYAIVYMGQWGQDLRG